MEDGESVSTQFVRLAREDLHHAAQDLVLRVTILRLDRVDIPIEFKGKKWSVVVEKLPDHAKSKNVPGHQGGEESRPGRAGNQ